MNRKAFTLVELLVVIAIIALLLSILMPSLQKAREQAKNLICKSNERQYSLAFLMYLGDNRQVLPPCYTSGTIQWSYYLEPYVRLKQNNQTGMMLSTCPSSKYYQKSWTYGYNYASSYLIGGGAYQGMNINKKNYTHRPSEFILVTDTGDPLLVLPYIHYEWAWDPAPRHNKGSNYIWLDGHVSWQPKKDWDNEYKVKFWKYLYWRECTR